MLFFTNIIVPGMIALLGNASQNAVPMCCYRSSFLFTAAVEAGISRLTKS
jgi:hypothetical protein